MFFLLLPLWLCQKWRYSIPYLFVLTGPTIQKYIIVREGLNSGTFPDCWDAVIAIVEMMPVPCINGKTRLLAVEPGPRNMNLPCALVLLRKILIISSVGDKRNYMPCFLVMFCRFVIEHTLGVRSCPFLIVTLTFTFILGAIFD